MVVASWRLSLHLNPSQSLRWKAHALKKQAGSERGLLLERKYRLEREKGGREVERQAEKQRERAGVGNPPLHLLVIYSFMLSRRLVR